MARPWPDGTSYPTRPATQAWQAPVRVSVVIEWKNQDLAADERADAMLDALREQWLTLHAAGVLAQANPAHGRLASGLEVLFVYDGEAARRNLDGQLAGRFEAGADAFALRLIEGAGLSYYEMKHLGAARATGDILIFLDSDVVPEPGWLKALLGAVTSDEVQVVCGNTYIEPSGLLGKAFALAWFFPLRSEDRGLETGARCYSNNLAVRTGLYRAFPFVEVPGTTRTAMHQLAARLAEQGIVMYKCRDAQVSHPHPRGLAHFLKRAVVHGRDIYLKTNHDAGRTLADRRMGGALREVWTRFATGMARTLRDHRRVGLDATAVPLVLAIMSIYYLAFAFGSLATHVAPAPMSRGLRI